MFSSYSFVGWYLSWLSWDNIQSKCVLSLRIVLGVTGTYLGMICATNHHKETKYWIHAKILRSPKGRELWTTFLQLWIETFYKNWLKILEIFRKMCKNLNFSSCLHNLRCFPWMCMNIVQIKGVWCLIGKFWYSKSLIAEFFGFFY